MSFDRRRRIVACLSGCTGWMPGRTLAATLGISLRTVQLDIARINADDRFPNVLSNRRLGYRLDRSAPAALRPLEPAADLYKESYHLFEGQIIMVLLFERSWISIEAIAERLFVSRSTVVAHLPRVRRIVPRTLGAQLLSATGKGLRIEADERTRRILCMKLLCAGAHPDLFLGIGVFGGLSSDIERLREALAALVLRHGLLLTDASLGQLVSYATVSVLRSCFGFALPAAPASQPGPLVEKIVQTVERLFGYTLDPQERSELQRLLGGLSEVTGAEPVGPAGQPARAAACIDRFQDAVRRELGIDLAIGDDLRRAFAAHIERLRIRMESGAVNVGRKTDALFRAHPFSVHVLRTCLVPLLGFRVPDAELGYMIPYLAEAIEANRSGVRMLLVSDESAGSVFRLDRALASCTQGLCGSLDVEPVYAFEQRNRAAAPGDSRGDARAFDLIVSTEPLLSLADPSILPLAKDWTASSLEPVRARALRAHAALGERAVERMRAAFPLVPFSDDDQRMLIDLFRRGDQRALLPALGIERAGEGGGVSVETIGASLLCVIAHGRARASRISHGMCEPFSYQGKRIQELIVVRFARDAEAVPFFDYVRDVLNQHAAAAPDRSPQ